MLRLNNGRDIQHCLIQFQFYAQSVDHYGCYDVVNLTIPGANERFSLCSAVQYATQFVDIAVHAWGGCRICHYVTMEITGRLDKIIIIRNPFNNNYRIIKI